MVARLAAGDIPSAEQAAEFFRQVGELRLSELVDADPVLRACNAGLGAGPHYVTRLLEALDALAPVAVDSRVKKGGA